MELTLRPRPLRYVLFSILSVALLGVGVLFYYEGQVLDSILGRIVGCAMVILFSVALLIFGSVLIPGGAYLKLDDNGFIVCSVFRPRLTRWSDIRTFELSRQKNGQAVVVFDYSPSYQGPRVIRKPAGLKPGDYKLSDYDGYIPDIYECAPAELAAIMDEWRQRSRESS
jgi:hypothetical protein